MLTFDEACDKVLMRVVDDPDDSTDDMNEAATKFDDVHQEVQESFQSHVLAKFLLQSFGPEHGAPVEELLRMAFSHGVMVGIQMEKSE